MSQTHSPSGGRRYGLQRVCRVWKAPRSSVYEQRKRNATPAGVNRGTPSILFGPGFAI